MNDSIHPICSLKMMKRNKRNIRENELPNIHNKKFKCDEQQQEEDDDNETASLNDFFPYDILVWIFSFSCRLDTLGRLRRVCKSWKKAAEVRTEVLILVMKLNS